MERYLRLETGGIPRSSVGGGAMQPTDGHALPPGREVEYHSVRVRRARGSLLEEVPQVGAPLVNLGDAFSLRSSKERDERILWVGRGGRDAGV